MEVNIYNVIWADDECATLKQDELIRKVFNEKRIEVLEYVPTSTALRNALETYKDEVDAVVVDGNFSKEDVDYLESDDISGLIHTVSFLELYNTKRDIPLMRRPVIQENNEACFSTGILHGVAASFLTSANVRYCFLTSFHSILSMKSFRFSRSIFS